ncbi:MAG: superoxide dismutase family protein, partial [Proteobacteria bacterium]|nr:superoxide dismutase family protein [Pseudomonadota bacterium]
MPHKSLFCSIFSIGLMGCSALSLDPADQRDQSLPQVAPAAPVTAALHGADGTSAGQVTLRTGPQGLLLAVEGENWPEGWHGVHLHAVGTCEAPSFSSAGGHLNPPDTPHPHGLLNWAGGPDSGDLQNVYAHADGTARAELYLARSAALDLGAASRTAGLALIGGSPLVQLGNAASSIGDLSGQFGVIQGTGSASSLTVNQTTDRV